MHTEDYLREFRSLNEAFKTFSAAVPSEYDYKFSNLIDTLSLLFDRFCPYKIGDKVLLVKEPEISATVAPGWQGAKHFLVKDAVATVRRRNYSTKLNLFNFGLTFDSDSWIDYKTGEVIPTDVDRRLLFYFDESYLAPLSIAKPCNSHHRNVKQNACQNE